LWGVNAAAGIGLLIVLLVRKNYRAYPIFTFYMIANLIAGGFAYLIFRRSGFSLWALWHLGWGMQAAVIFARALAVAELCRHMLSRYVGVWGMAWRVLLGSAALVLLYSSVVGKYRWDLVVTRADRSVELAIAVVLVGVLLFVRYYRVQIDSASRLLALGFCFYSCFNVLNNTILERYLRDYVGVWNILGMTAYLMSLLLWTWALRVTQSEVEHEQPLLSAEVYQTLVPQVNLQLRALNERLIEYWKPEATRH
jgi:hypothetical protein